MSFSIVICSFVLALFCNGGLSAESADHKCKKDLQNSEMCYMGELEKSVNNKTKWGEYQKKINHCFNESKCDNPSYTRNPLTDMPAFVRNIGKKISDEWNKTSTVVKQCIKQSLGEKIGEQLNKCLQNQKLNDFNFTEYMSQHVGGGDNENPLASFVTGDSGGSNSTPASDAMKRFLIAAINVIRTYRICNEAKIASSQNASSVKTCLNGTVVLAKNDYCKHSFKCRNGAGKTASKSDCQKKGESIYRALCLCKQEKVRELVTNLDELRQKDNVSLADLIKGLSQGQDVREYLSAIRNCYKNNNESVPPIVSLAMAFSENMDLGSRKEKSQGTNGTRDRGEGNDKEKKMEFNVDKLTLDTIRDFLESQCFSEEECKPCDDKN